jgi:hypothetical protein
MRALMLLHIVFASKSFVANRAEDTLLPCVFLAMARCMAGSGERCRAIVGRGVGTWIFVLFADFRRRRFSPAT